MMRWEMFNREVYSPILKLVLITVLVVAVPVMVAVHPLFWVFGLTGTIRPGNGTTLTLDRDSFRKKVR